MVYQNKHRWQIQKIYTRNFNLCKDKDLKEILILVKIKMLKVRPLSINPLYSWAVGETLALVMRLCDNTKSFTVYIFNVPHILYNDIGVRHKTWSIFHPSLYTLEKGGKEVRIESISDVFMSYKAARYMKILNSGIKWFNLNSWKAVNVHNCFTPSSLFLYIAYCKPSIPNLYAICYLYTWCFFLLKSIKKISTKQPVSIALTLLQNVFCNTSAITTVITVDLRNKMIIR